MNILQIWYSQINNITKQFLDGITSEINILGKKENNYWIIKGNTNITSFPTEYTNEVNNINILMQIARDKGYTDVMIIDR